MTTDHLPPHDAHRSEAQVGWLVEACADRRVVDLGCGDGRIAGPVSRVARSLHVVDTDAEALEQCVTACEGDTTAVQVDMTDTGLSAGQFDVALCLGNTFSLIWDVTQAVDALRHWRSLLAPGGAIVLDDLADDLWPSIADGHWSNGIDEAAEMQMVWARDDAVFAVRVAGDVDESCWTLRADEPRMRLWTAGSLTLASMAAGCARPVRHARGGVLMIGRDG